MCVPTCRRKSGNTWGKQKFFGMIIRKYGGLGFSRPHTRA